MHYSSDEAIGITINLQRAERRRDRSRRRKGEGLRAPPPEARPRAAPGDCGPRAEAVAAGGVGWGVSLLGKSGPASRSRERILRRVCAEEV